MADNFPPYIIKDIGRNIFYKKSEKSHKKLDFPPSKLYNYIKCK